MDEKEIKMKALNTKKIRHIGYILIPIGIVGVYDSDTFFAYTKKSFRTFLAFVFSVMTYRSFNFCLFLVH